MIAIIPLVSRTLKSFNHWLAPSLGAPLHLDYDVDRIEALSGERAQEWSRVGGAAFLSDDEKREAVGYGKVAAGAKFGAVVPEMRYSPDQPRDDHGRWSGGGGGSDGSAALRLAANDATTGFEPVRLQNEEAPVGKGHTIEKHVGKTDQELLDRLDRERSITNLYGIQVIRYAPAIGSFKSIENANSFVNDALRANIDVVTKVASGVETRIAINYRVGSPTGVEAFRPNGNALGYIRTTCEVRVVLIHLPKSPRGFSVLTAFPVNQLPKP